MAKKGTKRTTKKERKRSAPDWAPRFLARVAKTSNILAACRAAKVARTAVYQRRDNDPDFAAGLATALDEACDDLELEARRRAYEGCEQPVFYQGSECGAIRQYSDTLMIFLLKAHRPDKYRENLKHEHTGPNGAPLPVPILRIERHERPALNGHVAGS